MDDSNKESELAALRERVTRLEEMLSRSAAAGLALETLVTTLMRAHPDRQTIADHFFQEEQRFQATGLHSAAVRDDWLQMRQTAAEVLYERLGGDPEHPTA